MCRHLVAAYEWSQEDNNLYDIDGNPPRRVWDFHRRTPVVRIDFMNTEIRHAILPISHNGLHRFTTSIAPNARPSLVVGDLFPQSGVRLKHTRLLFPSEQLPSDHPYARTTRDKLYRPWVTDGLMDQYHVDEDKLLDEIMRVLSGEEEISIGSGGSKLETSKYCCLLEEALQDGLIDALPTEELDA